MKSPLQIIAFLILLIGSYAHADIAVLIHGYHSTGNTWRSNNITRVLASQGWQDAGFYTPQGNYAPFGVYLSNSGNYSITAELPSESPVEIQANLLSQYLNHIMQQFDQQKIHLIAHSAGGIVARLALVDMYTYNKHSNISQLITIATPHLGSVIAEVANRVSNTPLSLVAPILGASEINRAKILYQQLGREEHNNFLYWLNRQVHPPLHYTSIIRANNSIKTGDWLMSPQSQNMTFVPAIGAQTQVILTQGDHYLDYKDGYLLLDLLAH